MSSGFTGPGFNIEPISIETGQRIQPGLFFQIQPSSSGQSTLLDPAATLYGVDHQLKFGDAIIAGSGDIILTTGFDGLIASFVRALCTNPGEIPWWPNYGVGIVQLLNAPATASNLAKIKTQIRLYFLQQIGVSSIDQLDLNMARTGLLTITTRVTLAGIQVGAALGIRLQRSVNTANQAA